MYTFRFNPMFQQWVLLGEPIPNSLIIQAAHKIQPLLKDAPHMQAATYPRQPFVLDPGITKRHEDELLYAPQPAVGEYELILSTAPRTFFNWKPADWEEWFLVLTERFRAFHLNPHLHFVSVHLATKALLSAGSEHERVGDLIATSHPVAGTATPVSEELVTKLLERERLFVVYHDDHGALYVPTAPLHHHEIWYLPRHEKGLDVLQLPERKAAARALSALFTVLHEEFAEEHWQMVLHTPMAATENNNHWWIQIYQDVPIESSLPISPLPERFTFLMRQLLAHKAVR